MAARLAPQKSSPDGTVKKRVGRRRFVQANSPARSGLHQTLADAEVIPQTEPKAVLEHRAPKTSPPILHSRGLESKAGRVPHVRDAPVWLVQTPAFRFESGFPRPHGRGYANLQCCSGGLCPPGSVAPHIAGLSCYTHAGENRRRSQNAATEVVVPARAPEGAQ